ncbi:hypothetical protein [Riemerella columbina]|uniref:hypothetical protein n=1 Tax=Riemerella columbina TaxID=103810 RepID=UPI0003665453|nr:hypothetical protein [Riemerella columbina]
MTTVLAQKIINHFADNATKTFNVENYIEDFKEFDIERAKREFDLSENAQVIEVIDYCAGEQDDDNQIAQNLIDNIDEEKDFFVFKNECENDSFGNEQYYLVFVQ